jgi:predicted MPP superfamily phosphohydrolase
MLTFIALGIIGFISLYSLVNGLRKPVVRNITVPIKKLPKELSGFSIVQLSDLHMEVYKSRSQVPYIVDTVNALKPDLIVITGDLIEGDICDNPEFCEHLKRLKATHGVVAVTGNHEFYSGIKNFLKLANKSNIRVLRNDCFTIADSLQIIGLDDDDARRFGSKGPDLDTAINGCNLSKPIILLYHRPVNFDQAIQKGVDLQLSGHTHAGQIPPMDLLVCLYYKYPIGLFKKNGSTIYTTSGTGYWGPPMRFLSRNEIVKITLVSN